MKRLFPKQRERERLSRESLESRERELVCGYVEVVVARRVNP
jgi:hypothetical protein